MARISSEVQAIQPKTRSSEAGGWTVCEVLVEAYLERKGMSCMPTLKRGCRRAADGEESGRVEERELGREERIERSYTIDSS